MNIRVDTMTGKPDGPVDPDWRWYVKRRAALELGVLQAKGQSLPHPYYRETDRDGWLRLIENYPGQFMVRLDRRSYWVACLRGLFIPVLIKIRLIK